MKVTVRRQKYILTGEVRIEPKLHCVTRSNTLSHGHCNNNSLSFTLSFFYIVLREAQKSKTTKVKNRDVKKTFVLDKFTVYTPAHYNLRILFAVYNVLKTGVSPVAVISKEVGTSHEIPAGPMIYRSVCNDHETYVFVYMISCDRNCEKCLR